MQVILDPNEEQYIQREALVEKLAELCLWEEDANKVLKINSKL